MEGSTGYETRILKNSSQNIKIESAERKQTNKKGQKETGSVDQQFKPIWGLVLVLSAPL